MRTERNDKKRKEKTRKTAISDECCPMRSTSTEQSGAQTLVGTRGFIFFVEPVVQHIFIFECSGCSMLSAELPGLSSVVAAHSSLLS